MDVQVMDKGAFSWALVRLGSGEQFVSEAGALFRASDNIDINVTTRQKGSGGLFGGIKRLVAGESFFFSTYTAEDHRPGEVGLAPTLQGEVAVIESDGAGQWLCAGGSYLGSSADLSLDTQFQGFRGMLSGESLSFLAVSGRGPLLVTSFGRINKIALDGNLTVDTGTWSPSRTASITASVRPAVAGFSRGWRARAWCSTSPDGARSTSKATTRTNSGKHWVQCCQRGERDMQYRIQCQPSYSVLEVQLHPGEQVVTEAGAMVV